MATLNFGLQQSLDGYVDHMRLGRPGPDIFHYFLNRVRALAGCLYGRRTYEIMRYWDEEHPEWDADAHAFAAAWRDRPKWVVSRSHQALGPNATLIQNNLEAAVRALKAQHVGEIDVAGPTIAHSLTDLGLIDTYRLNFRPIVLGHGTPFFAGPRPPLRLVATDRIGQDMASLTYVPA